jgi:hypothetical protein
MSTVLLVTGLSTVASVPALAGPCLDRITEIEKRVTMLHEGAGPVTTGTVQSPASGGTASGAAAPTPNDRLPANRPPSPDDQAAQAQVLAEQNTPANPQDQLNRFAATRPSPDTQAAEVQARLSAQPPGGQSTDPSGIMARLQEAKNMDQAGREADCIRTLSSINDRDLPPLK